MTQQQRSRPRVRMTGAQRRRAAAGHRPRAVRAEGLRGDLDRGDRRPRRRQQAGRLRALRRQGGAVRGRRRPGDAAPARPVHVGALARPAIPGELLERAALVLLEYIEDDTDGFRVLTRDVPGHQRRRHLLLADRRGRPQGRAHPRPASSTRAATTRTSPSSTARRWSAWSPWSGSGGWTTVPRQARGGRPPGQPGLQRPRAPGPGPGPGDDRGAARGRAPDARAPGGGAARSRGPVRGSADQPRAGHGPEHGPHGAEDPGPGELRGQPDGARARPRPARPPSGPEPLTSAASAPASVAARSARPSSGRSARAAACRSLASAPARADGGPLRSAAMTGIGRAEVRCRRAPGRPPAAGPARRRRRASRARPPRSRAPSATGSARAPARAAHRGPLPRATPPCEAERDVAAEPGGEPVEVRRGRRACPRARPGRPGRPRRRRCHRPGRRRPGSTWRSRWPRPPAPRRARPAARRPARRGCGGRSGRRRRRTPVTATREPVPRPHGDRVEERHGEVDRAQLVETVGPQRPDARGAR